MAEIKKLYVLTHGQKGKGANPGLTFEGRKALEGKITGVEFSSVVCGTGRRHRETLEEVGLRLEDAKISAMAGKGDSLEMVDDQKIIILEDGTHVPFEEYQGITPKEADDFISLLPHLTLVIGGRELLVALGKKDAESGALYRIEEENPWSSNWVIIKDK